MRVREPGFSRLGLGLAVIGAVLAGCITTVIPLGRQIHRSAGLTPLPVSVGVYYSPDLASKQHIHELGLGDRLVFPIGEASVGLFDQVMPMLFERTEVISGAAHRSSDLAAIIHPEIEDFAFVLPQLITGMFSAEIAYRFTLSLPEGEQIVGWTVRGQGQRRGRLLANRHKLMGEAVDLAMEDAAVRFVSDFRDVPEMRQWIRSLSADGRMQHADDSAR